MHEKTINAFAEKLANLLQNTLPTGTALEFLTEVNKLMPMDEYDRRRVVRQALEKLQGK